MTSNDNHMMRIVICTGLAFIVQSAWGNLSGLVCLVQSGTLTTGLEFIQNKLPFRKIVIDFLIQFMNNQETSWITIACCCFLAVIMVINTWSRVNHINKAVDKAIRETANEEPSKLTLQIAKEHFVDAYHNARMRNHYCVTNNLSIDAHAFIFGICSLVLVCQLLPNWQPTGILEILRLHPSISDSLPYVQMSVATVMLFVIILYHCPLLSLLWRFLDTFAYKAPAKHAEQNKTRPPPFFKPLVNIIIVLLLNMFLHGAFGHANRQIVDGQDYTLMLRIYVMIFVFLINKVCHIIPTSVVAPLLVMIAISLHLAYGQISWIHWIWLFQIIILIEQQCDFKCEQNPHFVVVLIPASRISGAFCWHKTVGESMKKLMSTSDMYASMLDQHKKHLDYFNLLILIGNFLFAGLFFIRKHRKTQKQMNVKSFCEQAGEVTKTLTQILSDPQSYVCETCVGNPGLAVFAFYICWSLVEHFISEAVQVSIMKTCFGHTNSAVDMVWSIFQKQSEVEFECTLWRT